jgi:hypothetical protein
MLRRRSIIKLSLLGVLASPHACITRATPIPSAEEPAVCGKASPDLILGTESETASFIRGYSATVQTDFRITRINPLLLAFRRASHYFQVHLDFANIAGTTQTVPGERIGNVMWHIVPLTFADWIFIDPQGFTQDRYKLNFRGPEQCQDRTCCTYDVTPDPKAVHSGPSPFFRGKIWVEPANSTIISFKGIYVPASHLKPTLAVENYFPFESHRAEVAPHLWLPSSVLVDNVGKDRDLSFPKFKSKTIFSNYQSR